jgi:YD repeat-containing protein
MKRIILLSLTLLEISVFSFAQTALPIKPAAAELPRFNYFTSPAGQKFVLSKIKARSAYLDGTLDTIDYIPYFDSLLFNQKGLLETRYSGSEGLAKETWEYDENARAIKYESYDGAAFKMRQLNFYNSNGDWDYILKYFNPPNWHFPSFDSIDYIYDDSKRLIQTKGLVGGNSFTYVYDEAGNLTEVKGQITMTYDDKNNLLSKISTDGSGTIYTRNEQGWPLSCVNYTELNDNWDSTAYGYNSNGQLTKKFHSSRMHGPDGDKKLYYEKTTWLYSYDEMNRLSSVVTRTVFVDNSFQIYRTSYTYNNQGLLLASLGEMSGESESTWKPYTRATYTYSETGSILSELTESYANSSWRNFSKVIYSYDNNGNCESIDAQMFKGGAWKAMSDDLKIPGTDLVFSAYRLELGYTPVNTISAVDDGEYMPGKFVLEQNYPNPFNPETKISFSLPQSGKASLKIYDMLGREVAELLNGEMEKGTHAVSFNGRNLSSGVYIYRLQSGDFTQSKKMLLLK